MYRAQFQKAQREPESCLGPSRRASEPSHARHPCRRAAGILF